MYELPTFNNYSFITYNLQENSLLSFIKVVILIIIYKNTKMMRTILTLFLIGLSMTISAQDWSGFYKVNVDEGAYQATLQAQVYQLNGEYWGQLRGNVNGEQWEIEFWTILNEGQSLDCYYDKGNDEKFPTNNAMIFSLVGNKAKFTTTFGEDLYRIVKHLETHPGFNLDTNEGEIQEFTSTVVEAPGTKPVTAADIEQPEQPVAPPTLPKTKSTTELIVGVWKGAEASDITKFFDYDFYMDGTGRRGNLDFNWVLQSEDGKDYLDIQYFKPITKRDYQAYLAKVDNLEYQENFTIINTTDGESHQIRINGEYYAELKKTERYKIDNLEEKALTLSFKHNGKTVESSHYKD